MARKPGTGAARPKPTQAKPGKTKSSKAKQSSKAKKPNLAKTGKTKPASSRVARDGGRGEGVVASAAKLLDATALAKMVVSQLEGAVRAVAMSMLGSRDGGLQDKYEQLSLDGQLEILATILEQAAEMTEVTWLDELDGKNDAQIARARSLVPIFRRLETQFKRLRKGLAAGGR